MSEKSSGNEVRWFHQRNQIRKLANAVFVKSGVAFKEVPVTEAQKSAMEKIVKAIDAKNEAAKKAKAAKASK